VTERFMGVDYGVRRIGIAIGDTEVRIAMPLATVEGTGEPTRDARRVADLGQEQEVAAFVVGLPLNMNSGESEQTALTRRFAAELERLGGRPVHLQDERLTSFAAEETLREVGAVDRRGRGLTDRIAAQKILQDYLDRTQGR